MYHKWNHQTCSLQNRIGIPYITQVDYLQNQIWISVKYQSWFSREDSTKPLVIFQNPNFVGFLIYQAIMVFESIKSGSKYRTSPNTTFGFLKPLYFLECRWQGVMVTQVCFTSFCFVTWWSKIAINHPVACQKECPGIIQGLFHMWCSAQTNFIHSNFRCVRTVDSEVNQWICMFVEHWKQMVRIRIHFWHVLAHVYVIKLQFDLWPQILSVNAKQKHAAQ